MIAPAATPSRSPSRQRVRKTTQALSAQAPPESELAAKIAGAYETLLGECRKLDALASAAEREAQARKGREETEWKSDVDARIADLREAAEEVELEWLFEKQGLPVGTYMHAERQIHIVLACCEAVLSGSYPKWIGFHEAAVGTTEALYAFVRDEQKRFSAGSEGAA